MSKAFLILLVTCCQFSDGDIIGVGFLPGDNGGFASGVSGDGSTVVGSTTSGGILPISYRWTEDMPIQSLGDFFGGINTSFATATSFDGSVVVGSGNITGGGSASYRWTEETGLVNIGGDVAHDVSHDGSVIVGTIDVGISFQGYIWSEDVGLLEIGTLPNGSRSEALGVSADGLIVTGYSQNSTGRFEAIRWSENTGIAALGSLAGGNFDESRALGISADGSTIVGVSDSTAIDEEAFRWTLETGMVGLGDLAGGDDFSSAAAASADGSIIVGSSDTDDGLRAFVWTETTGMLRLESLLAERGFDLSSWQSLNSATGISDNGRFIVGTGTNIFGQREGYRIRFAAVPEPSTTLVLISIATCAVLRRRQR